MYQEMLSEGSYDNWSEYCTLVELAKQEYEEELARQEYEASEEVMTMDKDFHVLILMGKSASGKDTLQKELVEKYGYSPIVSTTSRPMREGEKEGVNYFYVSPEEFEKRIAASQMLEYRSYNTTVNGVEDKWYYGTEKLDLKGRNVVVLDMQGAKDFINYYGKENCSVAYVVALDITRKERAMSRGSFDEAEWNRRKRADFEDFHHAGDFADYEVFNEDSLKAALDRICIEEGLVFEHEFALGDIGYADFDFFTDVFERDNDVDRTEFNEEAYEHLDLNIDYLEVTPEGEINTILFPIKMIDREDDKVYGADIVPQAFIEFDLVKNEAYYTAYNAVIDYVERDGEPEYEMSDFKVVRTPIDTKTSSYLAKSIVKNTPEEMLADYFAGDKILIDKIKDAKTLDDFMEFSRQKYIEMASKHTTWMRSREVNMAASEIISKLQEGCKMASNKIHVERVGDDYVVTGTFKGTVGELCEEIKRLEEDGMIPTREAEPEREPTPEELAAIEAEGIDPEEDLESDGLDIDFNE